MRVPARIYVSEKMLEETEADALRQVINVATLPGIVKYSLAMPDLHTGYGFVIGGVAATKLPDGVISPGGIGYDQNCGVRLLKSRQTEEEIRPHLEKLATEIQKEVPSGLGRGRKVKLSIRQIDQILEEGVPGLVKQGYGNKDDIENCESGGRLEQADASMVSERAKNRGRNQVGTLGSGNHFVEVQKVEEIFDQETADAFGLFKDQVVVMAHTGSRGLGHQNCTDYLRVAVNVMPKYNIRLPDRELACVPFNSPEGQRFFKAMSAAANFAWANRHMIAFYVEKAWKSTLGQKEDLELLYDVAHNIAKVEEYEVDGQKMKLCVHRKGATRAFPPGNPEIPEKYRKVGQPVLIPGSMGTASYVLAGEEKSKEAWHTVCHGAGRIMSRREAKRRISGHEVVKQLGQKGIIVKCWSPRGIAEEAPMAYKDVDKVVQVVHNAGLSKKVVKLVPLAVIKGE
ncbi:MAG: RtcB family protein [Patescibacteria group bacterium]|nr:RtcB family protein [Patescibacteria group bacterium]